MKNLPFSRSTRAFKNSPSKARDPRRAFSLTRILGLGLGLAVAGLPVARATTEFDVLDGQTDLFLASTYSQNTPPTIASDITFNLGTYTTTTFGLSGDLSINALNDLSATALTIANSSGAARTITLNNNTATAGVTNVVAGAAATDALFVASGGSLTIQGGTGATALGLVLNTQPGTFSVLNTINIAGTGAANIGAIISGAGGFAKTGTGTLTLSAANTFTGPVQVAAGTLAVSGSLGTSTVTNGSFRIGTVANTSAVVRVLAGANISRPNIFIGDVNGGGTGSGAVYQSGGTLALTQAANGDNVRIGSAAGSYGYYNLSGGALTANEFGIGASLNDTVGVMDVTGGMATSNGYITVGRGGATSSGLLNVTGGTVNFSATGTGTGPLDLNFAGTAGAQSVVNVGGGTGLAAITGGATTTVSGTNAFTGRALNLASANVAGTLGVANLLANGTLTVSEVTAANANPTAVLNFNGGTLKATATNTGASFLINANIDQVNVFASGGTIDNSGTGITIGRPLLAPAGSGVSATTVTVPAGGTGYVGAPLVKLSGGTGVGATGYATISNGMVTGIVITSPGTGYTAGDTLTATFVGGGASTAATTVTSIPVAANTSGGLTFTGAGTTTLTGGNTYTGATNVSQGTLAVAQFGGLTGTSSINISTGATFDSSAKGTPGFTVLGSQAINNSGTVAGSLTTAGPVINNGTVTGLITVNNNGTLGGTGTVSGATAINGGGVITGATNGTVGMLTLSSNLTFAGASGSLATYGVDLSGATSDRLTIGGILNLSGTFDQISFQGTPNGTSTYVLATYASLTGTFDNFNTPSGYMLSYGATELDLVAVPEPSTWIIGVLTLGALGFRLRRVRVF